MGKNRQNLTIAGIVAVIVLLLLGLIFFDNIKGFVGQEKNTSSKATPTPIPATLYPTIPPRSDCATVTNLEQALQNTKEVCILDLSNQNISTLPKEVANLGKLEKVILTGTKIPKSDQAKIKALFRKNVEVVF